MAQRQKPLVGLDIDPVGVRAAQVSVNGHLSVTLAAHTPLEPGVVRDGEITDVEALTEALKTLYRDNKGLDKRVRVGVANQKIVVRTIELPPIDDRKELDAAVRFQAQDEIPMPLDQAVLDWQPLDVVDTEHGPRQRILLVAARRDMIERVVAAVKGAGLRLEGVDLGAFAMIRALDGQIGEVVYSDEAVLYAEVGGLTNLAVAKGGQCLFTRASGTGLEGLAVELAERRGLTLEHARGWLSHVGLDRPVQHIEGDREIVEDARLILEDGVRRISAEIRQSLDFHHMQTSGGAGVARAVLTGGAISIAGFAEAIGAELGLPVGRGAVAGEPEGITPGDLTIAAGLAVSGMPGVNLLPADERRAAGTGGRSGGAVYAVLAAMGLILLLSAALVVSGNGISSKRAQLAATTAQADRAERTAAALQSYTTFASLRQNRVDTVRSLVQNRFDWAHALGEIARTLPKDVWLSSLDGSVSATSGNTSSSVRSALPNPAVDIVGCTTSQSGVARMMSAMRRVDGVVRVSLQSSKKGASGSGTGGGGGCNGDQHPSFTMTLFFEPVAVSAPSTAATATAAATTTGATGAAAPATGTATPATGTTPAPSATTATTPSTTTSGGGTQ